MAHAEFPEEIARHDKHAGDNGQKHCTGVVVAADEVHQRVILHERVGDDVGAERQHALAVDGKRVAPVLAHTVC